MHWVQIDDYPPRWALMPYSTQLPTKIRGWWHQETCKILVGQCTCSVGVDQPGAISRTPIARW